MAKIEERGAYSRPGIKLRGAPVRFEFNRSYQVDAPNDDRFLLIQQSQWRRLKKCIWSADSNVHDWAHSMGSVVAGVAGSASVAWITVPAGSSFAPGWSVRPVLLFASVALSAVAALLLLISHTREAYARRSVLDVIEEIKDIEATFPIPTEDDTP